MKTFDIVVAHDINKGIGLKQRLPWHIKADLKHFRTVTSTTQSNNQMNAVIMGRKTWQSLPSKNKPLPNRYNVILSKTFHVSAPNVSVYADFNTALQYLSQKNAIDRIFVIGGKSLYQETLNHSQRRHVYVTAIDHNFHCDVFLPNDYTEQLQKVTETPPQKEQNLFFRFLIYQ